MNLHISKSKNSESFYIAKSYLKENESISSIIIQNLGTLNQLLKKHDHVLYFIKKRFLEIFCLDHRIHVS